MMPTRKIAVYAALIIGMVTLTSQDFTDEEKKIIDRGVEIELRNYRLRKQRECKNEAIEKAVGIVDSMVRALGKYDRIEKVVKPPRPSKPDMPPVRTLPDSVATKLNDKR